MSSSPPVPRTHADFHAEQRRLTRRFLRRIAIGAIALPTVAALGWLAFITFSETAGPLTTPSIDGVAFSAPAGRTVGWGQTVLVNHGNDDAVLKSVRAVEPPPGLGIVDVRVGGPDRRFFSMGSSATWPDPDLTDLHPVRGARIAPASVRAGERGAQIVLVVRAQRPGRYIISKLEVAYRVGRRDHRRTVRAAVALCAHATRQSRSDCDFPRDWSP